jgi:hypothetical protein
MSHLDICSPSYGQKKGRESNWYFDSRPLKVENRPESDVSKRSANGVRKLSKRATRLLQTSSNWRFEQEVMDAQSLGSTNWDNFKISLWEFREKVTFRCRCGGVTQRIQDEGRWWLPLSQGHGESSGFVLPVACPNTKSDSK